MFYYVKGEWRIYDGHIEWTEDNMNAKTEGITNSPVTATWNNDVQVSIISNFYSLSQKVLPPI